MTDGDFSKEAFEFALKKTYQEFIETLTPETKPKAFILGGQPGAGKTGLQKIMSKLCNNNLIVINGDEFRELHPDFQKLQEKYGKDSVDYTGKFSGQMTESLIERLKKEKYNVLVEGTLRTAQVPLKTCNEFKRSGYNVTLALMAVKPQISYLSTIMRYEDMIAEGKTPRATSKEAHDLIVKSIPGNLRQLQESNMFDKIVMYNREGCCLYDSDVHQDMTADKAISSVFNGRWSQHELDQFCEIGKRTQLLMEKRYAEEIDRFTKQYFNVDIVASIAKKNDLAVSDAAQLFFSERSQPTRGKALQRDLPREKEQDHKKSSLSNTSPNLKHKHR